jgi:membrane-bound inhibitor of C-type lysozyme
MGRDDGFDFESAGLLDVRTGSMPLRSTRTSRRVASAVPDHGALRMGSVDSRWACVAALVAVLSAGCDTTQTRGEYEYSSTQPGERREQFACRDGEQIQMHFLEARGIALLTRRGRTMELKLQSSESGSIYSNGPTTVRSKGRDLRLQMEGMEPIECHSRRPD